MGLANGDASVNLTELGWLVGIHLTFVVSGVLLALMDWLACRAAKAGADRH
jgi:uncharacterized membrane protein YqhA